MTKSIIPVQATRRVVSLVAMLLLLVFPAFAAASPAVVPQPPLYDLGDAPDSSNHFGMAMRAYPTVPANFPTVYDPVTGLPRGPRHFDPDADSWLGADVSQERDADQLPDEDGERNIKPLLNDPDNDEYDDGVADDIVLPHCQETEFKYIVTGAPGIAAHDAYVNVWFDFNRDGDWADTLTCGDPAAPVYVPEWAVQDQVVAVIPGGQTFITPRFLSFDPSGHERPIWMRITLAEDPAPQAAGVADGRGPAGGYQTGETEDYGLVPILDPNGGIVYTDSYAHED